MIPYSAAQLYAYEFFKHSFQDDKEKTLSVPRRLAAGACAGMVSTLATYPLDSIRLRLAVDPSIRGMAGACKALVAEGGMRAFYRGVGTSMFGETFSPSPASPPLHLAHVPHTLPRDRPISCH